MTPVKDTLLIELHHLPLTSYFSLLQKYPKLLIEACETFPKQTLRNRTYILAADKVLCLSVPVLHATKSLRDVKIDYSQSWLQDHVRGLTSSYKHAPYFEYYFPYFQDIYMKKHVFLWDLNMDFFVLVLRILKWQKDVAFTELFVAQYDDDVSVFDNRSKIRYNTNMDSKSYLQVFGNKFSPNLSILDLLFNLGPDSPVYL